MNPEWVLVGIGALQMANLVLTWRNQRDQARSLNAILDRVHKDYLPRELAEALYLRKPDSAQLSAVLQHSRAKL